MGWYCKECDDWFVFGYSKKYCSEECYDEKEERKERKRERRRAEARKEEILKNELSTLKLFFQKKWGVEYNASLTKIPKIQELIKEQRVLADEISSLNQLKNDFIL